MKKECLIPPRSAAEELGISLPTLRRITERGDLPAYRIGAHQRYKPSDIQLFIEQNRRVVGVT